ncbi:hypothetical protein PMAYCL1PPCAC_20918, partial [Pristionchus mayeri]
MGITIHSLLLSQFLNCLMVTEEGLGLGSDGSLEALLHVVELSEAGSVSVVDGSELVGNLVTEDEALVSGGRLVDSSGLAAGGVVSSLGGTEVHLGE